MNKQLKLAVFLVGCNAVIVQAVLIRELAQVFFGTELLIGLGLAFWLLWGAAGAAAFRAKEQRTALSWFLALLMACALLFTGQLLLIRAIRVITGSPAGLLLGLDRMALFCLLAVAPTAFANGALFSLALALNRDDPRGFSRVYRWDVWGGFCGGLLGALLLIPSQPAFVIAQCAGLLYLMPALLLALREKRTAPALLSLILLLSFSLIVFLPLERISSKWLFPGQDVVATGVSRYSQLAVVRNAGQYSLYENGQLAALWPDAAGAEERCLVPLSLAPRPARVLLIGGGLADCALLASLPGLRTTYLEIDQKAWRLFYPCIGETAQRLVYGENVEIVFEDYRAFLNRYRGPKYDLALVNLPDPYNAGVNRGYTREFYRSLRGVLADSGVARLSIVSNENYLSPALRGLDASVLRTVAGCFARTALQSGDRLAILASAANGLGVHPDTVMARLRRLGIAPRYLSPGYLSSKILPDRIEYVGGQLARERAPENRDLRPVGYAYQLRLSSLLLKNGVIAALLGHALNADWRIMLVLSLLLLIPVIRPGTRAPCAALAAGFAGMVALLAVLLAFQALQGYVYHLVALVSACYLAGLALGGAVPGTSRGTAALPLAGLSLMLLVLIPLSSLRLAPLPLSAAFCGCAALAGVCGGRTLAALVSQGRAAAGALYAFDLAGGALGAVCFALWWLPAFGQTAALLAAAILLAPVILLILPLTSHGN